MNRRTVSTLGALGAAIALLVGLAAPSQATTSVPVGQAKPAFAVGLGERDIPGCPAKDSIFKIIHVSVTCPKPTVDIGTRRIGIDISSGVLNGKFSAARVQYVSKWVSLPAKHDVIQATVTSPLTGTIKCDDGFLSGPVDFSVLAVTSIVDEANRVVAIQGNESPDVCDRDKSVDQINFEDVKSMAASFLFSLKVKNHTLSGRMGSGVDSRTPGVAKVRPSTLRTGTHIRVITRFYVIGDAAMHASLDASVIYGATATTTVSFS